jgi:hypothetical protein
MMRRSNLFWGIVVLLTGILLLLEQLGILTVDVWGVFWAVLFILLGVWVLLGATGREKEIEGEDAAIPLEGAQQAKIHMHHGGGRLLVGSGALPGQLVSGSFRGGLSHRSRETTNGLEVEMRVRDSLFPLVISPFNWGRHGLDWQVNLTPEIPLALELHTGASETRLDLSDLRVTDLRLETGASSTEITTPAHCEHTRVRVNYGAASVRIRVPEGVAARIRTTGGLMDASVDRARFPKSAGYYQSPDYETAPFKVEMHLEGGVGSIRVS